MAEPYQITYIIFLVFTGTAVLSTFALFTRQSLLVAYIALGALLGPWGLKLVNNSLVVQQAGNIGIIFLLFLLGLDMQPQSLFHSLRKMSVITILSTLIFFAIGFIPSYLFGYSIMESVIIGIAATFSSTIIGIKLLPTTILHHQHTGELMISILLLQDVIAIAVISSIEIFGEHSNLLQLVITLGAIPLLIFAAYLFQRLIIAKLLERFDKIHEYIFILSIGWCLCLAQFSHWLGLSDEIGAFIAGVAMASNPISFYIAENLKPLRDFFLVIFFFTIGASFNFDYFFVVIIPALIVALLVLTVKPLVFRWLLYRSGEVKSVSKEIGIRLGQMSEFSLLLNYMALETHLLTPINAYMLEAAVIITFIGSCYWTVMRYPTPLAASDKLRRD
jgi:Kef-type K+ transport system membrane component KefB